VEESAPADQLRQELVTATDAFDSANKETELKAQIDGLKRSFSTELNAERIPEARNTLSRLQQMLPGGDPFITGEAPQMLADTYSTMATRALAEGRFDPAEQLARDGLKENAEHQALLELLVNIKPMRLEANTQQLRKIIEDDPPTDSASPKNLLTRIRSDAGAEYPDIEAELKQLANERVSASKGNRDAVIGWVAGIFGDYTPPSLAGTPCTPGLAGFGSRSRGQCFDYLPGSTTEGPRLAVIAAGNGVVRPFAISRQEISVGQWNAYCTISGNCAPRSGQSEQVPITNIEAIDAIGYAEWLSSGTKYAYRLPTDAEWEHAATADGSAQISPNCINQQAGLLGDELLEVNRGGQNKWGIMNYVGNAQEWVIGPSGGYEARGGSYKDRLGTCKIELTRPHAGGADEATGFRLVREIGESA
jgi:hypothetical protein